MSILVWVLVILAVILTVVALLEKDEHKRTRLDGDSNMLLIIACIMHLGDKLGV